jgi:hypothetical protein
MLPKGATYADDVDLSELAQRNMQGAHIRRALTRAAFRAASTGKDDPEISASDLRWASNAEYEDMGRLVADELKALQRKR